MAEFKGGLKEAAKLLQGLTGKQRERVLNEIRSQDPVMAERIQREMVQFEDLKFLSVKMLQDLLKEISLKTLGRALRIGSPELRGSILSRVSVSMKREIEEILKGPPLSVDLVEEARAQIMAVVLKKVEKGELVFLNEDDKLV